MGSVSLFLSTGSRKVWQGASQAVKHESGPNLTPSACCGRSQVLSSLNGEHGMAWQAGCCLGSCGTAHCLPASLRSRQGCPLQEFHSGVARAGPWSAGTSPGQSAGASPRQSAAQQAGTGVQGVGHVPDAQGQAMLRAAEGAPARQQQQVSQLQLQSFTADLGPCRCKRVGGRLSGCDGPALQIAGDLLPVPRTATSQAADASSGQCPHVADWDQGLPCTLPA